MDKKVQLRARRAFYGFGLCALLGAKALLVSEGAEGITFNHHRVREVPWSIHVVKIDRTRSNFQVTTALGDGTRIGLSPLTEQLKRLPKNAGTPLAAINGDFYQTEGDRYEGDPRGVQISGGEIVSGPGDRTTFWIDPQGEPHIGEILSRFSVTWPDGEKTPFNLNEERSRRVALYTPAMGSSTRTSPSGLEFILEPADPKKWLPLRAGEVITARVRAIHRGGNAKIQPGTMVLAVGSVETNRDPSPAEVGDLIKISTETVPSLRGVQTAIGGGPTLVRGGQVVNIRAPKSGERHPRSAVGWNKEAFFFVQVDGRQPQSDGMTLKELGDFMSKLKCDEAMNLDGGGSSEVWMTGKILNRPCFGYERSTANALVIVEKKAEASQ